MRQTPKLVKIQVRSNITNRVLAEKSISESTGQYGKDVVVNNILEPMVQDKRDVYVTVVNSELDVIEEYNL